MNRSTATLAAPIAQGWTLMFLLFLSIFFFELAQCVINEDLSMFRTEAGRRTMRLTVVLVALHALMPMLVCMVDGKRFRWAVFGVTVVLTLVLIVHQILHLARGEKPFDVFQMLDVLHHILGIQVAWLAWLWARQASTEVPCAAPNALSVGQSAG